MCPIHRGAGTRIKIIEAAINAVPTVSTAIGAEGLAFERDKEILIADTAEAFAEACVQLLMAPEVAERIANAALCRAEALYSPAVVRSRLEEICRELVVSRCEIRQGAPGT